MTRKYLLGDLSWTEHAEISKESAILIIPLGVIEQHGPAGIEGADYILSESLACQVAERLEEVYVAPVLTHGYTPTFRHFAGTISLRPETLFNLLLDVVEGYIGHGWRKIVIFNSHRANDPIVDTVGQEIREKHKLSIAQLSPWQLSNHVAGEVYGETKGIFGHGGEVTLSVMMALRPGAIDRARLDRASFRQIGPFRAASASRVTFEGFSIGLYTDTEELSPSGTSGNGLDASEEKGRRVLDRMADYSVRCIAALQTALG